MSTNDPNAKLFNPHTHTTTAVNTSTSYTVPNGGLVGAGMTYTTGTATTTIPYGGFSTTAYVTPSYTAGYASSPDLTISGKVKADDFEITGISLKDTLKSIQHRLAILDNPNPEKLKRYAALKEAYEQYKILEALIGDGDNLPTKE